LNYREVSASSGVATPQVYTAASSFACGAHIVNMPGFVFHDTWSPDDKDNSFTFRELKAVYLALKAYGYV